MKNSGQGLIPRTVVASLVCTLSLVGCSTENQTATGPKPPADKLLIPRSTTVPKTTPPSRAIPATKPAPTSTTRVAGSTNVYQYTRSGVNAKVAKFPTRVYVPNSDEGSVSVIDPFTYKVIDKFRVGKNPQHIGPSWDLAKLYVSNDLGNSLTPIDPATAKPETRIPVTDPYNLYYTPDGRSAIVVAERLRRLDFRDPHTWLLQYSISIPRKGANHLDFSADGKFLLISCEFSGWVEKIDLATKRIVGEVDLKGTPIDVKLSPDGTVFYVANMARGGVSIVNPATMTEEAFLPTGMGAHGLYPSRDTKVLFVSNRLANSVSVIDFATKTVVATWPFKGTPDMGGVSADGTELWLSGRYSAEVYVIDTRTGLLTHRIPVGKGPHGLSFFPQPGRFSIGHTGNYR